MALGDSETRKQDLVRHAAAGQAGSLRLAGRAVLPPNDYLRALPNPPNPSFNPRLDAAVDSLPWTRCRGQGQLRDQ